MLFRPAGGRTVTDAKDSEQGDRSRKKPVSEGSASDREDQPPGTGASEGQVDKEAAEYVWPTLDDVKGILYELASGLFGSPEEAFPSFQIENQGLLESALGLPHQPYYESFADKLAALTRSIACNHALVDGNKRLAVTVLHSTLVLNGYAWLWSDEDAANAMVRAASGDDDFRWLADFINLFTVPIPGLANVTRTGPLQEMVIAITEGLRRMWADELPQQVLQAGEQTMAATDPALRVEIEPSTLVQTMRAAISAVASGAEEDAPASIQNSLRIRRTTRASE